MKVAFHFRHSFLTKAFSLHTTHIFGALALSRDTVVSTLGLIQADAHREGGANAGLLVVGEPLTTLGVLSKKCEGCDIVLVSGLDDCAVKPGNDEGTGESCWSQQYPQ